MGIEPTTYSKLVRRSTTRLWELIWWPRLLTYGLHQLYDCESYRWVSNPDFLYTSQTLYHCMSYGNSYGDQAYWRMDCINCMTVRAPDGNQTHDLSYTSQTLYHWAMETQMVTKVIDTWTVSTVWLWELQMGWIIKPMTISTLIGLYH